MLLQFCRPLFERRRLLREHDRNATLCLIECGLQVFNYNAPRDAIDYEVMEDQQQALGFFRAEFEQHYADEWPFSKIESFLQQLGDLFDRSALLVTGKP
jgi:hypothetical protein